MQPKQQGIVFFDTQPHGAQIIVDGQILVDPDTEESLRTPKRVLLYEGRRDFILRLEGHNDEIGYVDVLPGVSVNIFRNMTPGSKEEWAIPEPQIWLSTQKTGIIRIYSFPDGADIFVNGHHVGKAPLTVTDVPAGVATVTFKMPGMMDEEKIVDIVEGAWSDTYGTMRPVLPKLSQTYPQTYQQNQIQTMNNGNLTIRTNPSGATIIIDGYLMTDNIGNPLTTPTTISLLSGSRFIEICKEGYDIDYYRVYMYEEADLLIESNLFPSPYSMDTESLSQIPEEQIPKFLPEKPKIPYYTPMVEDMMVEAMECPSATEGIVVITTYPSGATIIMDGKTLIDMETGDPLTTPVDLAVEMGYHTLMFKLKGFFDEFDGIYVEPMYHQYRHKNFNIC